MVWFHRVQHNLELTLLTVNWKQTAKDQFWTSTLYIDIKAINPVIQYADLNLMTMMMIKALSQMKMAM